MPQPTVTSAAIVFFKNNKHNHFCIAGSGFDTPTTAPPQVEVKQLGLVTRFWDCKVKTIIPGLVLAVKAKLRPSGPLRFLADESGLVEVTVTNATGAPGTLVTSAV